MREDCGCRTSKPPTKAIGSDVATMSRSIRQSIAPARFSRQVA
jgi:hypothetical protein